jgi:hypothetical protein
MKKIFLLLFLSALTNCFAQGNLDYTIIVQDNYKKPLPNIKVIAVETSSLKKVQGKTDATGKILLKLYQGKVWSLSVGQQVNCKYIDVVKGSLYEGEEIFVYDMNDYKRKKEQDNSRSLEKFKKLAQNFTEASPFKQTECMLIISLVNAGGKPVPNTNLKLVNTRDSIAYTSVTNKDGKSIFIVPNNSKYDIDVNDLVNFNFCDFGKEFVKKNLLLEFNTTVVTEKIKNDTAYQVVNEKTSPSTERALIKLMVRGGKKGGVGEPVYLRDLKSGKVFTSKVDVAGNVFFLVPIKRIYMVDMLYQRDADGVNMMNAKEMTYFENYLQYLPDPRLESPENFIPKPQNLLQKSMNSFLTKQFEKPKDKPFLLKLKSVLKLNKQSQEALFLITLAGSDTYRKGARLGANISFVLDKSGSMYSDNRSECLKKSLLDLGGILTNKDVVSVTMFDHEAVAAQHTLKNHMEEMEPIISNYTPGGGTNIFAGLKMGVEMLQKDVDPAKPKKIILLTDGYGSTPPLEITQYVEEIAKTGVEFSAIGVGTDFDKAMLELIAKKGNGNFSYVNSADELTDALLEEVKGNFSYVATDVKVEIQYGKKLGFANLFGYQVTNKSEGKINFEIAKLPAGANQIAFLKFKTKDVTPEITQEPLKIKVSYFDLETKKNVSYEEDVQLSWTEETETQLMLDQEEKMLYAIASMNQCIKNMAEAYAAKDVAKAKAEIKSGQQQMDKIFPDAKPKEIKALLKDADDYLKALMQIEKNKK